MVSVEVILGSALIGAIITGIFQKKDNDSNNKLKYITNERAIWRNNIRNTVSELVSDGGEDSDERLIAQLELNLNPNDKEDEKLIKLAKSLLKNNSKDEKNKIRNDLLKGTSLLLKHDWERAKCESRNKVNLILNLIISVIIAIFAQWGLYKLVSKCELLIWIKRLISQDLVFYIITTIISTYIVYNLLRVVYILCLEYKEIFFKKSYKKILKKIFNVEPSREEFKYDF